MSRDVGLLEQPAELMKKADGQIFDFMQSPAQMRLAQHIGHEAGLLHKATSLLKVRIDPQLPPVPSTLVDLLRRRALLEPGRSAYTFLVDGESAALERHPAVAETVVAVREVIPGNNSLVGYVVPRAQQAPAVAELRSYLRERLPEYMAPSIFVTLDRLPLTSNGKVNRNALPLPDQTAAEMLKEYVAPSSAVERVLVGMWAEALGVERVGIHDDFFDLGGHSLLATQLISRLRDAFEIELSLRSLFEAPTPAGFAATVLEARKDRVTIEHTAELLMSVALLSDEEVEAMLTDEIT